MNLCPIGWKAVQSTQNRSHYIAYFATLEIDSDPLRMLCGVLVMLATFRCILLDKEQHLLFPERSFSFIWWIHRISLPRRVLILCFLCHHYALIVLGWVGVIYDSGREQILSGQSRVSIQKVSHSHWEEKHSALTSDSECNIRSISVKRRKNFRDMWLEPTPSVSGGHRRHTQDSCHEKSYRSANLFLGQDELDAGKCEFLLEVLSSSIGEHVCLQEVWAIDLKLLNRHLVKSNTAYFHSHDANSLRRL